MLGDSSIETIETVNKLKKPLKEVQSYISLYSHLSRNKGLHVIFNTLYQGTIIREHVQYMKGNLHDILKKKGNIAEIPQMTIMLFILI